MEIITFDTHQHSVHPFPLSAGGGRGGGVEPPTQFLKRGGLDRNSIFRRGSSFYIKKNKLKSEIFNDKKSLLTKMFFSVITKNLNQKILSKNLVFFKRWDWVKDEKF